MGASPDELSARASSVLAGPVECFESLGALRGVLGLKVTVTAPGGGGGAAGGTERGAEGAALGWEGEIGNPAGHPLRARCGQDSHVEMSSRHLNMRGPGLWGTKSWPSHSH